MSEHLDFDQPISLNPQAKSDLYWNVNNLSKFNGRFSEIDLAIDICIECDASLSGWGAFYNGQSANGHWPTLEALKDINYLELLAALWFCKPLCLTDKLFLSVTKAR